MARKDPVCGMTVGCFVVPIVSPDSIGIVGGDFAELRVRYRWAKE